MRKNKRSPVVFIKKPTVVATQVALAVLAQVAYAQQQPVQTAERVERVEITGSRLPALNVEGPSPITTMNAEEIRMDGLQKAEDLLNNLPQVQASQSSTQSNGATGTANVNLRNLGPTRNLVLLNGRRLPAGSPRSGAFSAAADLNEIPTPLIQRVELLTGGASAVYGSDAITGVVNFIMNDRFEGLQIDLNGSFYNHHQHDDGIQSIVEKRHQTNPSQFNVPNDVNDGKIWAASALLGSNFADNKGNATAFFQYKKEDPVSQANRDFSACALGPGTGFSCAGSSTSYPGRFTGGLGATDPGYQFTIADAAGNPRAFSGATDQFNFGPYNYFRRPSEQYAADMFAHLDVHPKVRAYTELGFHDNHTLAQIAPSGIFFGDTYTLDAGNPLLSPAIKSAIAAGQVAPFAAPGDTTQLLIGRRNVEGGGRVDDIRHTSYRAVLGAKGEVTKDWNYDAYVQTARVIYTDTYLNDFSKVRIQRALDVVSGPGGVPTCRSALPDASGVVVDPNCVPYDIFHLGGVNQAALNYLQTPGVQNGLTSMHVYGGTLSSDLGNYGVKLPSARDGVSVLAGAERRKERLQLQTDVEFETNDLAGQGGATRSVQGTLDVDEIFTEVRVPIAQRVRFADVLSVNGSYRHSAYSTNKDTNTWGFGAEWAPVREYRFRGSVQRAIRHANIQELFQPQGTNLFGLPQDPCGASPTATLAQCARTGITPAQYGSALVTNPAGQYNFLQGGNADLNPETAKTWTVGLVANPVRNLTATIDYWRIKIDDAIGNAPPATILQQCLNAGQFCNLVVRDPATGALWFANSHIVATNQNLGGYDARGVDVAANYTWRMGNAGGFGVNFVGSWLQKWEFEPIKGLGAFDCAGLFGQQCSQNGGPNPTWRHKARATWSSPFNVDLALTWRHISEVKNEGMSDDPHLNAAVPPTDQKLGVRDYIDIAALWTINKTFALRFGINNVFDRDPPIVSNTTADPSILGNGNTFPGTYDCCGRLVFMNLTMKF
ncbi:MAG TPA: TonB-dependent receptor [Burkholderiales bacterium]|nr:TonB-dependent receptor [Burkholderiales bacterium]